MARKLEHAQNASRQQKRLTNIKQKQGFRLVFLHIKQHKQVQQSHTIDANLDKNHKITLSIFHSQVYLKLSGKSFSKSTTSPHPITCLNKRFCCSLVQANISCSSVIPPDFAPA